jgi:RNA polymerase sigma-70 factor (ECF subfamily)
MQLVSVGNFDVLYATAFDAHWRDVFQVLLAWTNDWQAAEDLAQETFLRLWRHRDRIDWQQPILPWLLVAGRRLATDRFRSLKRHFAVAPATQFLQDGQLERWLDVQAALVVLSPLERTSVVLTAFLGLSNDETARVLDTTPGAVRSATSRARTKLGDA